MMTRFQERKSSNRRGGRCASRSRFGWLVVLLLLGSLCAAPLGAQVPRLVVVIVIDLMGADYLERFRSGFGPGGFNRLLEEGAVFANCHYEHDATETAPGHSVLSTGSYPRENGIVGNGWYDRSRRQVVAAVADESYPLVGGAGAGRAGASPRALQGDTLGDRLRLARSESRVVAVSWKDRSAILLAGKNPDAAFWFDNNSEGFVTSTYYMASLPSWVDRFNREHRVASYRGREWKPLRGDAFEWRLEMPAGSQDRARFWSGLAATPFAVEMHFGLAQAATEAYRLGEDSSTDILWIGLSATDYLGHQLGPNSPEIGDMFLRIDRQLAEFFQFLHRRFGEAEVVVALSSDHGVASLPERTEAARLGGGRLDRGKLRQAIQDQLAARWGAGEWIEAYVPPGLYLNQELVRRRGLELEEVARAAGEAAMKHSGVIGYYTAGQLAAAGHDPVQRLFAHGYYPRRSGDVVLRYAPFVMEGAPGATPGSVYSYDRHVPLLLWGRPFRRGTFSDPASPADLAPTLAAVLKITSPALATGRVLSEVLVPSPQGAALEAGTSRRGGSSRKPST